MAERPLPLGDGAKGDNNRSEGEADAEQEVEEEEEGDDDEGEGDESEDEEEVEERVVRRKIVIVVSFGGKKDEEGEEEGESSPPRSCGPPEPRHGPDVGCQVDGCDADLGEAKRYHRRHRVCEGHAKAAVAAVGGVDRRFCQQCSRFHELSQFDGVKRSCRKRLSGHNERRRKVPPDLKADVSERRVAVP